MDWIELGYIGMFVSAVLAATVLPLGSEIVFAGLLFQKFDPVSLTLTAAIGNTIGGMISYWMGHLGKWSWLEKWFGISKVKVLQRMQLAQKWGSLCAFLTWLPVVGDLLAVVLGFIRFNVLKSVSWMFVGKLMRFAILATLFHYGVSFE